MTRLVWMTDVHLNFVEPPQLDEFFDRVVATDGDVVLLGGDIAEAPTLMNDLARMSARVDRPIYFVLGNHDYYRGSIQAVRRQMRALCRQQPKLVYLSQLDEPVELAPHVGLIGHDGWADAREGDYDRSLVMLNDYRLIDELAGFTRPQRRPLLEALGDEAAAHVARLLPAALDRFAHVYVLTHVPPMREACWHEGALSDDEWAPHFTCQSMGRAMVSIMRERPEKRLTVLCGHTHSAGQAQPLPNLTIETAAARYGHPEIARVIAVERSD